MFAFMIMNVEIDFDLSPLSWSSTSHCCWCENGEFCECLERKYPM